jgi:beta-galactosidase
MIPNLYLVRSEHAENIVKYVENGGTVVMSFFSGIVNEHEHIWLGGYPAPFRKMLGLTVEEFVPFMPNQTNTVCLGNGIETSCSLWADVIHLEGAQALGTFRNDFYAGKPAITRNQYGSGTAYYLGTRLPLDAMQKVFEQVYSDAGVTPALNVPAGVEVILRKGDNKSYLCVLNHLPEAVTVDLKDHHGTDLLTGQLLESQVSMEPYAVRILLVQ